MNRPPDSPWPAAPPGAPGLKVGFPEASVPLQRGRGLLHRTLIALVLVGLGALTLVFVLIAVFAPPGPAPHCTPLQCQEPPLGRPSAAQNESASAPVSTGVLYTGSGGFTLRYIASGGAPAPSVTSSGTTGITLTYPLGGGSTTQLQVVGAPAGTTTAQGVEQTIVNQLAPGSQPVYQVPGAMVGYAPGFGEAFDVQSASSDGSTMTTRIIVIAAVVNSYGIAVIASGPLLNVTTNSSYYAGHPSPANVAAAYFTSLADPVINSITFPSAAGP
jgi:hypothetical protein